MKLLSLWLVTLLVACGSTHEAGVAGPAARSDGMQVTDTSPIFHCETDSDCVAVDKAGCGNGTQEAVNKQFVRVYLDTFASRKPAACPLILINDNRLPRCNTATLRCELVYPHKQPK